MKKIVTIIISYLTIQSSFAQNQNDFYTAFSDSGIKHNLNFDVNNMVRVGSIRRHMAPFYDLVGTYKKTGDSIYIKMRKIDSFELPETKKFGLESFSEMEIVLYQKGSELIDPKNRTVYVTSRKLNTKKIKRKGIACIEGKKYIYERFVTDGYGLIRREPRKNKKFEKAFSEVLENSDNYETKVMFGLTAYDKYGLIGINGVSIINKKD